jgi:hypothetical protein
MQVIRRHQQFQTEFRRYLHIRHVFRVFMFQVVIQVFADFFENDAAVKGPYLSVWVALGRRRRRRGGGVLYGAKGTHA